MEARTETESWAELEQRALASARRAQEGLRELNEAYFSAERRKREIADYYRLRRLRRLAGLDT